jgi:hypothetical protein
MRKTGEDGTNGAEKREMQQLETLDKQHKLNGSYADDKELLIH